MNKLLSLVKDIILLVIIILTGFLMRITSINWDSGHHFHPDERMLIMVADGISLFDKLNPNFFNYGSLPIYLLRGISQLIDVLFRTMLTNYDGMLYIGRALSTLADLFVILLVYKVAQLLFKKQTVSLWAALLYSLAFFPIQNSHFFIVDTFLNLFTILLLYLLLRYYQKPSLHYIPLIGITFAAALTTKVSAIIFIPVILFVLILPISHKQIGGLVFEALLRLILFVVITLLCSYVFMPYGFIEYQRFITDIQAQIRMNSDAYTFPYTLQYVGSTPYLYYLKNIAIWGLGPFISMLTLVGGILLLKNISWKNIHKISEMWTLLIQKKLSLVIFSAFYLAYFIVIGKSAVKFMRYMLLMYPFFIILAGYALETLLNKISHRQLVQYVTKSLIIIMVFIWTFAFISIYKAPNTRLQATEWIRENIPTGSSIAVEHWDDRIPVQDYGYQYVELPLYERPDNEIKWESINMRLSSADYIVIASNRLYVPLQRLSDCDKYIACYPQTSEYYQQLFAGQLPFKKVAEFTSYPNLQIGPLSYALSDDSADESFTVYDHPKIMIFKRVN